MGAQNQTTKQSASTSSTSDLKRRFVEAETRIDELVARFRKLELQLIVERHHPRGGSR
jgi:hypothetical protein